MLSQSPSYLDVPCGSAAAPARLPQRVCSQEEIGPGQVPESNGSIGRCGGDIRSVEDQDGPSASCSYEATSVRLRVLQLEWDEASRKLAGIKVEARNAGLERQRLITRSQELRAQLSVARLQCAAKRKETAQLECRVALIGTDGASADVVTCAEPNAGSEAVSNLRAATSQYAKDICVLESHLSDTAVDEARLEGRVSKLELRKAACDAKAVELQPREAELSAKRDDVAKRLRTEEQRWESVTAEVAQLAVEHSRLGSIVVGDMNRRIAQEAELRSVEAGLKELQWQGPRHNDVLAAWREGQALARLEHYSSS